MIKPNKCKNCQWYSKPYWSIINPCDNCPNKNDNITIITIGDVLPIQEYLTEEEIKKAMTNKSIFEITLEEKDKEIERLKNGYCELEKYFTKPNKFIERPERMKILDKLKELKERD